MRTVISVLFALFLISLPLTAIAAEGPMKLPAGSNSGADMHNKAGIKDWNAGNIEGALKHFQEASAEDSTIAETISMKRCHWINLAGMATLPCILEQQKNMLKETIRS